MTKVEFVEMLTIMSKRSKNGTVIGARCKTDVGSQRSEAWASLLENIHGKLYVDDGDEVPTRENGMTYTRLYPIEDIDGWPFGVFEKLSGYHWWIDPEDEINLLDVMAAEAGIRKQRVE